MAQWLEMDDEFVMGSRTKGGCQGTSATGVGLAALGEGNEKGVSGNGRVGIGEPTSQIPWFGLVFKVSCSSCDLKFILSVFEMPV